MKKLIFAGIIALLASTQANAAYISVNTGADISGTEVSLTFAGDDIATSNAIWQSTGDESGAAIGEGWSLSQAGDTFGDSLSAAWMFVNNTQNAVSSILINAWAGNAVFDIIEGDFSQNGSGPGREFIPFDPSTTNNFNPSFSFLNAIEGDELFGSLLINFETPFAAGSQALFIADTDGVAESVSTPSVIAMVLGALAFIGFVRRK
jgi:hypothetical protein